MATGVETPPAAPWMKAAAGGVKGQAIGIPFTMRAGTVLTVPDPWVDTFFFQTAGESGVLMSAPSPTVMSRETNAMTLMAANVGIRNSDRSTIGAAARYPASTARPVVRRSQHPYARWLRRRQCRWRDQEDRPAVPWHVGLAGQTAGGQQSDADLRKPQLTSQTVPRHNISVSANPRSRSSFGSVGRFQPSAS